MLEEIEIEGFRGFRQLKLEGLSRVNLVVGRNNSGKTSLLEAVASVVNPREFVEHPNRFRLHGDDQIDQSCQWMLHDTAKATRVVGRLTDGTPLKTQLRSDRNDQGHVPIDFGKLGWVKDVGGVVVRAELENVNRSFRAIPVQHIPADALVKGFGLAVRQRAGEERLERILKTIDPRIQKLRVDPSSGQHVIVVDVGLIEMIPLSQAGQGISRLVTILSEIIGHKPDICFIDEIENGIHHSAMEDVWKGIAEACEQLNVQLFATTHSFECIEAAHAAFSARANYDFRIVQLFRVDDGVQGRVLDQRLIAAAMNGEIDVRGA
jgi:energy-coupling factor transporter ATP-binding protein EcfA2